MTSSVERYLTRTEADREVWGFLDRLSRIANSSSFVWEVEQAAIGEAYLAGDSVLDGIDIALKLRRKPRFAGDSASALREAFRRRRVWRVLRGGCPVLRLHELSELESSDRFRILYRAPDTEIRSGRGLSGALQHKRPERSAAG